MPGLDRTERLLLLVALFAAALPVWGMGQRRGISLYEMLWRHTVFAPRPMYIPREYEADGRPVAPGPKVLRDEQG